MMIGTTLGHSHEPLPAERSSLHGPPDFVRTPIRTTPALSE